MGIETSWRDANSCWIRRLTVLGQIKEYVTAAQTHSLSVTNGWVWKAGHSNVLLKGADLLLPVTYMDKVYSVRIYGDSEDSVSGLLFYTYRREYC